jgi:transposase-like protein
MSKHRRHWSESEKKAILLHYQEQGASSAARQFEVSTSMIYRWATDSLPAAVQETQAAISSKEYHRLLRENQALKELVAEKELEIRIKDALLKKTSPLNKSG